MKGKKASNTAALVLGGQKMVVFKKITYSHTRKNLQSASPIPPISGLTKKRRYSEIGGIGSHIGIRGGGDDCIQFGN